MGLAPGYGDRGCVAGVGAVVEGSGEGGGQVVGGGNEARGLGHGGGLVHFGGAGKCVNCTCLCESYMLS